MSTGTADNPPGDGVRRRDFLYVFATASAAVGAATALWPFIDQMNPSADVLAEGAPIETDLAAVEPGQQIIVVWRGKPIFILHRTPAELKVLQEKQQIDLLVDPDSAEMQQPAYANNWHRSIKPEYLLLVGICTHLGCIPEYRPRGNESGLGASWLGGYFCPCHGSEYDLSGRVYKGVPAPYNLPVPPYRFVSNTVVRIGENPPGVDYSLSSVQQI